MFPGSTFPQQRNPLDAILGLGQFGQQGGYNFAPQPQQPDPLGIRAQEEEANRQKEILKARQKAQKAFEQGQQHLEQASKMQAPKAHQPFGYRDLLPLGGIALIAKLLGASDRDLAQGGQGFMQGRQQYAETQDANAQNAFNAERQNLQTTMQGDQNAQQFYSGQADDLTNDLRYDQNKADTERARVETARDKALQQARSAYDSSNLPAEKRRAAAVLRSIDPQFAPSIEQVEQDIKDLQDVKVARARDDFQNRIRTQLNAFGLVDEQNRGNLESFRNSLAAQYGVDPASIGDIPTGETLQKQHYDQLKTQFDQTFKFRSDSFKTTTAQAWARIEIAKKQLEINREGLGLRSGGLDLSERRFQYQINKDAGLILGASTKELVKARHDLAVEQAKLDQMKARNPATFGVNLQDEATAKQKAKVQDMQDEVAALEQLQRMAGEETVDAGQDPQANPGDVQALPGNGSYAPARVGGLPPGPIGGGKPGMGTKPTAPKTKPKTSAPKGQQVYNQGGVTIRKRG